MLIINLTQHDASSTQLEAGVVDFPIDRIGKVRELLTFDQLPAASDILARARELSRLAFEFALDLGANTDEKGAIIIPSPMIRVMIGGALWLMAPLEEELGRRGFAPLYSFSCREVVESGDTKVVKFQHLGWVPAVGPLGLGLGLHQPAANCCPTCGASTNPPCPMCGREEW